MTDKRIKLVIGIDFGTTFSGICFGLEDDPDLEVIQEWPGNGNSTSQKVPTVIAYNTGNDGGNIKWGYQAVDMKNAVRGVKLLLDKSKDIKFRPSIEAESIIEEMRRTPTAVAGEYLKKIVSHARLILDRRGIGSLMKAMDVQYILTVPAVWSDKAKDLTRQAAHLAGIPESDTFLLSEPEAAAVYTIRTIQSNNIAKGDCFIVCDAGGGTVDLITYQVIQTNPMRMEEVVAGTGAVCGSVMLDERFEDFLLDTIGKEYHRLPDVSKRQTLEKWQNSIKPSYSGPELDDLLDAGYMVPLPGIGDFQRKRIHKGMLHMENEDVQGIFDPVMIAIENLISDQQLKAIKAGITPKAILLVGGLGASEYLYKRLKQRFEGLDIMQPRNAWSAIARGAVYRGLEGNQIQSRKARCNYGVPARIPFDPEKHAGKPKAWYQYEECWMVEDSMTWYIRMGKTLAEGKPISFPFYRTIGVSSANSSFIFEDSLFACVKENAPDFLNKDVVDHSKLTSDLSRVPKKLFERCVNSHGQEYYKVNYELVLTPQSASLSFELQVNSMSYGIVRAQYY